MAPMASGAPMAPGAPRLRRAERDLLLILVWFLADNNRRLDALLVAEGLALLNPDDGDALPWLAWARFIAGDASAAVQAMERFERFERTERSVHSARDAGGAAQRHWPPPLLLLRGLALAGAGRRIESARALAAYADASHAGGASRTGGGSPAGSGAGSAP